MLFLVKTAPLYHSTYIIFKNRFFLVSLLVFFAFDTLAQISGITGKVTDSSGSMGLANATVRMVQKSFPSDTISVITNEKGNFSISKIPQSAYTLYISYSGYKLFQKRFFSPSPGVTWVDLGEIGLAGQYKMLDEVVVEAPPIVMKEDTIEYRAGAFQTKPNAMTEDLLKKLPGVQVDRSGNITAQGKQVTRIKVNGKDFFSGDPKTASRELPADMIDKVQVIDDYGDQASFTGIRDGEPEKIINLQLKKDKNKGWFGRAKAAGGTQERYGVSGNMNYFNNKTQVSFIGNLNNINQSTFNTGDLSGFGGAGGGGGAMNMGGSSTRFGGMNLGAAAGNLISGGGAQNQDGITNLISGGVNVRTDYGKRNSFYGSYVVTGRKTFLDQITSQQNLINESVFTNRFDQINNNRQRTHRFFFNNEIWIDSFNYIKISPNISVQGTDQFFSNDFSIIQSPDRKTQAGFNRDTTENKRPSVRLAMLYNHRFRKKGRNLSLNLDWGWNELNSDQWRINNTTPFLPDGTAGLDIRQTQQIIQNNRASSVNMRLVYTEPVWKDRFLDLSYQLNHQFTENDRNTLADLTQSGQFLSVPDLSNAFKNDFNFNRFGAGIRTVKKKYNYTFGLLIQPVTLRGYSISKDSVYKPIRNNNLFPVARFTYNFTKTHSVNFSYNGSAQQPSFSQLQPVRDITNPQYQQEGNPALRPSVTHSFNTSYNQFNFNTGRVIFANLSFSFIRDQIVNNSIGLKGLNGRPTGAQLVRPENVNGAFNLNAFYTYSYPWNNRMFVLSYLGTINYNNNINLIDSVRNTGKTWLILQGLNLDFNFKEWVELSAGGRYNVNKVNYSLPGFASQLQESWTISFDGRFDLPKNWVIKTDMDYTINSGLATGVTKNIMLLNASLEKVLTEKKNITLRLEAFDILNQNINVSRNVSANTITDSRVNRLTQFFMIGFEYRLNRFKGQRRGN